MLGTPVRRIDDEWENIVQQHRMFGVALALFSLSIAVLIFQTYSSVRKPPRTDAAQSAKVAELERHLEQVRLQLAHQSAELDSLQQAQRGVSQPLAAKPVPPQGRRVDFEVARNHPREIAPGISMGITGSDISRRSVKGWLWVKPENRTIWLRGQALQKPLVFYGYRDGKKRELMLTSITANTASGYLLLPP